MRHWNIHLWPTVKFMKLLSKQLPEWDLPFCNHLKSCCLLSQNNHTVLKCVVLVPQCEVTQQEKHQVTLKEGYTGVNQTNQPKHINNKTTHKTNQPNRNKKKKGEGGKEE